MPKTDSNEKPDSDLIKLSGLPVGKYSGALRLFLRQGADAALVFSCDAVKAERIEAAKRLVSKFKTFPFDKKARKILLELNAAERKWLLGRLPHDLVAAAEAANREPRRWRFGQRAPMKRRADGTIALLTFGELMKSQWIMMSEWVRVLKSIAIRVNQDAILEAGEGESAAQVELDEKAFGQVLDHAAILAWEGDLPGAFDAGDSNERWHLADALRLSKRERELVDLFRTDADVTISDAAAKLAIAPSTVRVLFHRIMKKVKKAAAA